MLNRRDFIKYLSATSAVLALPFSLPAKEKVNVDDEIESVNITTTFDLRNEFELGSLYKYVETPPLTYLSIKYKNGIVKNYETFHKEWFTVAVPKKKKEIWGLASSSLNINKHEFTMKTNYGNGVKLTNLKLSSVDYTNYKGKNLEKLQKEWAAEASLSKKVN